MGFILLWQMHIYCGDGKEVERDMYAALLIFRVLVIRMGIKREKINLGFFQIFPLDTCAEVPLCPIKAGWRSLLV